LLLAVKDVANGGIVGIATLVLGDLVASKTKNVKVDFPQNASMKLKVMYEGLKAADI
jgi:hypothetical protein